MSRVSIDEYDHHGNLRNGYDYDIQCWVREGLVSPCEHRPTFDCRCTARRYAGRTIAYAREHEMERRSTLKKG